MSDITRLADTPQPAERVPDNHPYGSITDGTYICGRCGESITGCFVCAGEIRHVVHTRAYPL